MKGIGIIYQLKQLVGDSLIKDLHGGVFVRQQLFVK